MPALTTHYLFGDRVLPELPEEIRQIIEQHRPLYHCALQGPDLLFFRCAVSGKSFLPKVGGRMHHEKIGEVLSFMKQYTASQKEKEEYPVLLTYFFGYICHYYLDKTVHPYVYFLTDSICNHHPEKTPHSVHVKIESQLDTVFYGLLEKRNITDFPVKTLFTVPQEEKEIIGRMYSQLLKEVFDLDFDSREIAKAFDDMKNLNIPLFDKTGILMTASNILGEIFPKTLDLTAQIRPKRVSVDIANLCENCWHHPENPKLKLRKSVFTLFQDAKEEVVTAMKSTYDTLEDGMGVHFDTDLDFAGNIVSQS